MATQDPSAQPEPTPTPANPPEPAPAPAEPPAPEPAEPEPKPPSAEARMRRERDEARREAQEAKDQLAEREKADAEAKGEWEKVAKQNADERDSVKQQLDRERAERRVESIASKPQFAVPGADEDSEPVTARFVNPDEALALLPKDTDLTSEEAVTDALKTLAESRPHLLQAEVSAAPAQPSPTPSGGAKLPAGQQPGSEPRLTREYLKGLSVPEIQKIRRERPKDFAAAMAGS